MCSVVPIAQRMLLSLWQWRQLWRVDIDRVLTAVRFIQFDQSGVLWPLTVHLFFAREIPIIISVLHLLS